VIQRSGVPTEEVRNYFGQLEGLGYITMSIKVAGADFRMLNMTTAGLQATSEEQELR
jgi:hypothetical protein